MKNTLRTPLAVFTMLAMLTASMTLGVSAAGFEPETERYYLWLLMLVVAYAAVVITGFIIVSVVGLLAPRFINEASVSEAVPRADMPRCEAEDAEAAVSEVSLNVESDAAAESIPEAESAPITECIPEVCDAEVVAPESANEAEAPESAAEEAVPEIPEADEPAKPVVVLNFVDESLPEDSPFATEAVSVRFRTSFESRYIQSGVLQDYYTAIKNLLLSYKGVKARTSWNYEAFTKTRVQCAKVNIKGNALLVYLPLDPKEYNEKKYHFTDMSEKPKFEGLPMLMKVKSERALKYNLELIAEAMSRLGIERGEAQSVDYRLPYESTETLAARGLVKVIAPQGTVLEENATVKKTNVGALLSSEIGE